MHQVALLPILDSVCSHPDIAEHLLAAIMSYTRIPLDQFKEKFSTDIGA